MTSFWARQLTGIYILVIGVISATLAMVFASGWWPASPSVALGFGATAKQCEAAYGHPTSFTFAKPQPYPRSVVYNTSGWYIMVSYDEGDRAEQFIFCKANLPFIKSFSMSEAEQKTLLDRFRQRSSWILSATNNGNGPIWDRADGEACGAYIADSRWFVFMNRAGLERTMRATR